jgi:hypothetical protein
MSLDPDRFASEAFAPHPSRAEGARLRHDRGTRRTTRLSWCQTSGGSGDTSPERVRARGPFAKRVPYLIRRFLRR